MHESIIVVNLLLKNFKVLGLSLAVVLLVSGCFVDEDKIATQSLDIPFTSPLYKHGDRLEYNVFGTLTTAAPDFVQANVTGSLITRWQDYPQLTFPFDPNQTFKNVLRETSELNVQGLGVFSSIRYITQDNNRCIQTDLSPPSSPVLDDQTCDSQGLIDNPNYRAIYLLAVDRAYDDVKKKYWATTDTTGSVLDVVIAPIIVQSPLSGSASSNIGLQKYSFLSGCDFVTGFCNKRVATVDYNEEFATINPGRPTAIGTFETLVRNLTHQNITSHVPIPDAIAPTPTNSYLLASDIDIRSSCNDPSALSVTPISGRIEVNQTVGTVYMFINCNGTGNTYSLHFELDVMSRSSSNP
ncbi:MAG: hypothetical protein ACC707_13550 [Thiohalomonadales bacterium]